MKFQHIRLAVFAASCCGLLSCSKSNESVITQQQSNWVGTDKAAMDSAKPEPEANILPGTYLAAGRLHEMQGALPKAIEQYQLALAGDPKNVGALNRMAMVYTRLGRFEEAQKSLEQAVEVTPDSALLRNNLGYAYVCTKHWPAAEEQFREALRLDPGFNRARINLGLAVARQDRISEALNEFRAVLPEPDALYNLGLVLRGMGRYQEAADTFELVLDRDGNFVAAQRQLDQMAPKLRMSVRPAEVQQPTVVAEQPKVVVPAPVEPQVAQQTPQREEPQIEETMAAVPVEETEPVAVNDVVEAPVQLAQSVNDGLEASSPMPCDEGETADVADEPQYAEAAVDVAPADDVAEIAEPTAADNVDDDMVVVVDNVEDAWADAADEPVVREWTVAVDDEAVATSAQKPAAQQEENQMADADVQSEQPDVDAVEDDTETTQVAVADQPGPAVESETPDETVEVNEPAAQQPQTEPVVADAVVAGAEDIAEPAAAEEAPANNGQVAPVLAIAADMPSDVAPLIADLMDEALLAAADGLTIGVGSELAATQSVQVADLGPAPAAEEPNDVPAIDMDALAMAVENATTLITEAAVALSPHYPEELDEVEVIDTALADAYAVEGVDTYPRPVEPMPIVAGETNVEPVFEADDTEPTRVMLASMKAAPADWANDDVSALDAASAGSIDDPATPAAISVIFPENADAGDLLPVDDSAYLHFLIEGTEAGLN